jgi:hypothetical protein
MEEQGDRVDIKIKLENYKIVPIDEVRPNSWNPKDEDTEEYQIVKKSIETRGQREAISVRQNKDYEILDGEQRWRACKELGWEKVLIYDWGEISDKDAKEETIWKEIQVPFNEIKLAELVAQHTAENPDFNLPFSDEQIQAYKDMASFDWDQYNQDNNTDEMEEIRTINIKCTMSQYKLIMDTINKVKDETDSSSEGRALELIIADYLAGAK